MTETEPEYDVHERDGWYEKSDYEQAICPRCGNLRSICSNPDIPHYPQLSVCFAWQAMATAYRMFNLKHDPKNPGKDPREEIETDPRDGAWIWMSTEDLTPDDDFI